jgi:GH15 family glucan-1,4-alpha-glucosidase
MVMNDIWQSIFLFSSFPSIYEHKSICKVWYTILSSLSFWKSYCKIRGLKKDHIHKNWEDEARFDWIKSLDVTRKKLIPVNASKKFDEAMELYKVYNYEQSSHLFKESVDFYGRYSEAMIRLAECYRILGMCKEAEDLCNQVCDWK